MRTPRFYFAGRSGIIGSDDDYQYDRSILIINVAPYDQ